MNIGRISRRYLSSMASTLPSPFNVLGVESSFDDSAVAIVDSSGHTHAHFHKSQLLHHLPKGGVNPITASDLHKENLPSLLDKCFSHSGLAPSDIHVVAYTKGPGLGPSLKQGLNLSVNFFREHLTSPCLLVGVHHMLAHALTARLTHGVAFPFLTLLVSGSHCLLCVVQGVKSSQVISLATALDAPPGNVLDHGSRLLRLSDYPEFSQCSGGEAIERISLRGKMRDPPLSILANAESGNYSFSGLGTNLQNKLLKLSNDGPVSYQDRADLALWFQTSMFQHIISQTNKSMRTMQGVSSQLQGIKDFVVSGGLARNLALQKAINDFCSKHYNLKPVFPPPHLCVDNAVMIAWAGVEYARAGVGIESPSDDLSFIPKWELGKPFKIESLDLST